MTPEEAIVVRLLDIGAVTALVDQRVYLDLMPQRGTYPAVLVQLVTELSDYHLRGGSSIREARVQTDAFAAESSGSDPYASAVAIADAIHGDDAGSGLSGWQGTIGTSPDLRIAGIFRIDRTRFYEADELRLTRIRQDYRVFFWA